MNTKEDSGQAFPVPASAFSNATLGMTLRQYAAIHLMHPDSGLEWLDQMIIQSTKGEIVIENEKEIQHDE